MSGVVSVAAGPGCEVCPYGSTVTTRYSYVVSEAPETSWQVPRRTWRPAKDGASSPAHHQSTDGSALSGPHLSTTTVSPVAGSVRSIRYVSSGALSWVHGSALAQETYTPAPERVAVVSYGAIASGRSAIARVTSVGEEALPFVSWARTAYR